ncbi:MAG: hypothetical protein NC311_06190 [Muribaculaceae bacterium]|nr:hypothetical protein [Muribaculaceae bacterium]
MAQQHRFYIFIATLILSNVTTKSVYGSQYGLSGFCDTDTTRTCYTCNPYTSGTNAYERHQDIIAGQCSDHNDAEVWCKTYIRNSGDTPILYDGKYYKCTESGWELTSAPDTPVTCADKSDGYHGHIINCCGDFDSDADAGSWCSNGFDRAYCDSGYYGTFGACNLCPASEHYYKNAPSTTAIASSDQGTHTSRTACFITDSGPYIDGTGSYLLTSDCYWS